ncbi:MAG: ABC-F family ATP-binding cassette domain-containing protein [Candidatus Doudnabacteria bacterium]|nr:ABC-F family ATP-binding cassette domain-containing protein [Candidatus Doudnabacteria bacterium]
MANEVVLRFSDVTFEYAHQRPLLDEASFSVRSGSRMALMGQNGAGKSTLFKLILGELQANEGHVILTPRDLSIAIGRQVIPQEHMELTVREYFATAFAEKKYNLDKLIANVFDAVNVTLPLDKKVREFSGGQQARLLLAYALIQEPDILLLDEPTNNLDQAGIEHLTGFLMMYEKTCLVISHDADFLNAFTDGVLYLDSYTKKVEQYTGNYYDVVEEIGKRIERENMQNARAEQEVKRLKAQSEQFAHKGGKLRAVAKRMRESAEEAEETMVDVRKEDKTIREFDIPAQEYPAFFNGQVITISSISAVKNGKVETKEKEIVVRKGTHLLIAGPNGVGKSTFLDALVRNEAQGAKIADGVTIGYYKQDFSMLDFNQIGLQSLMDVMQEKDEQFARSVAAGFLLDGKVLATEIGAMSEGQKGLLAFCRLVLMKPGLLILDEPTNHINFRHLPVIAKALDEYEGALVMVSHIPDFVSQIRVDEVIDLGSI